MALHDAFWRSSDSLGKSADVKSSLPETRLMSFRRGSVTLSSIESFLWLPKMVLSMFQNSLILSTSLYSRQQLLVHLPLSYP